jgi:3',5'-cyclic-nucleotide phosphodiesterase
MNLTVLGCAGGIGGAERLTTCLLLDDDILLDAGTGISELRMEELVRINHIFLTHSHLDHVAGLPFLLDAVLDRRQGPVIVHASQAVIDTLNKHLFNWMLWPDFAVVPNAEHPVLHWEPLPPFARLGLGIRGITAYPVKHTVPSVAYLVDNGRAAFLFSGDMSSSPEMWAAVAGEPWISKVIVDCSFPDAQSAIAQRSMHYSPRSLLEDIASLPSSIALLVTHMKPGYEQLILQELRKGVADRPLDALKRGDRLVF